MKGVSFLHLQNSGGNRSVRDSCLPKVSSPSAVAAIDTQLAATATQQCSGEIKSTRKSRLGHQVASLATVVSSLNSD